MDLPSDHLMFKKNDETKPVYLFICFYQDIKKSPCNMNVSNGKQPTVTSSTGIYYIVVLGERLSLSTTMMQNSHRFIFLFFQIIIIKIKRHNIN